MQRRDWPLDVRRDCGVAAATARPRFAGAQRAGSTGAWGRGLQWLQHDGSVHVDFYEQWAVPPAQAVEDDLRQWLADAGLFSAVVAPGSLLHADFVLEGELNTFMADLNTGLARRLAGAGAAGSASQSDQGAVAENRECGFSLWEPNLRQLPKA